MIFEKNSNIRIAYSGIEGSFASMAVNGIFGKCDKVPHKNFASAYKAVENGDCEYAVLPIENSYAGEVGQVTDLMFKGDLKIYGIYELPVTHCLLGIEGSTKESIKQVISHPQALEQCTRFIETNSMKTIPYENTARAAREVSNRRDISTGAIGSVENAELYNLVVLEEGINDSKDNVTRFAVFGLPGKTENNDEEHESFVMMFTVKHAAGSLAGAIGVIGDYGINMRVIRSRPLKEENWKYYFYIEADGDIYSDTAMEMLDKLKGVCEYVKILGKYTFGLRL